MANLKSKRAHKTSDDEVVVEAPPKKRRGGKGALGAIVALALGGSIFVAYHRGKDPARQWARTVERNHAEQIEARLRRCFGGTDAAAIRRIIPEIRRGSFPEPFRACDGPVLTELAVSPMVFAATLSETPPAAENAKTRERDRLDRLRGSIATLQRASAGVPRNAPIPEDRRDRIASALEDVAVDVDGERTGFQELVTAAESAASAW